MWNSSRESSVVAVLHEQTPRLYDPELAPLKRSADAPRLSDDLVLYRDGVGRRRQLASATNSLTTVMQPSRLA